MEEEKKQPEEQQSLPKLLQTVKNAPSQETIEQWKTSYGEVFVSGFSETELYVWRPIMRPEYVNIQTLMQNPENGLDQFKIEEMICDICVLFPLGPHDWSKGKAGTPQTLSEQIMQNSHFLAPAAASMLVARL